MTYAFNLKASPIFLQDMDKIITVPADALAPLGAQ